MGDKGVKGKTSTPEDGDFEKLKLLYTEAGLNFRHFLNWRHALLAGYFAMIAALALAFG